MKALGVLVAIVLTLISPAALAQQWDFYSNARFGYVVEVPPDFQGRGESDNGDGQAFSGAGARTLTVWGGHLLGDFEAEVNARMGFAEGDGWAISYQATTPQWASFSGVMGGKIFYTRMIQLCDRQSYAAWTLQYSNRQAADMKPVVERLVGSFHATGC